MTDKTETIKTTYEAEAEEIMARARNLDAQARLFEAQAESIRGHSKRERERYDAADKEII